MFRGIWVLMILIGLSSTSFAQTLEVTGKGVVAAQPDIAKISFGIEHQDRDPSVAYIAVDKATKSVIDALINLGIEPKDIQTSRVSLETVRDYNNNRNTVIGYAAAHSLTVHVDKLDQLGHVISIALQSGANEMRGLSFYVKDPVPLLKRAKTLAVENAIAEANHLAAAAGVELSTIEFMTDCGARSCQSDGVVMAETRMLAAPATVATGAVNFSSTVKIVFNLDVT
jgi:uncharacterized protein YggE